VKAILRSAVLAAGVVSAIALSTTGASAQGAGEFNGSAHINCFGCGVSTGTAELSVTGEVNGSVVVGGITANAHASFTVNEPTGPTCVVSGSASGTVTGAVSVDFNWTRVGAVAVITTSGQISGAGVAAFVVTSPVGVPCPGPVDALVVGAVAGA
jgi:hypothetical protein